MDIHQLKQRIDASGKKLVTPGNEYIELSFGFHAVFKFFPLVK